MEEIINKLAKELGKLGISAIATDIYLTGLRSGPISILALSKLAHIPRATVYLYLNELQSAGLAAIGKHGKRAIVTMTSPVKLIDLASTKEQELKTSRLQIESLVPELEALLPKPPQQPSVHYYEDDEGIKTALTDTLEASQILVYCSGYSDAMDAEMSAFIETYIKKGDAKGIETLEIVGEAPDIQSYLDKFAASSLHHIKVIPRLEPSPAHIDKIMYGDKIAYISYDYANAVVIKNAAIAKHERTLFMNVWQSIEEKAE